MKGPVFSKVIATVNYVPGDTAPAYEANTPGKISRSGGRLGLGAFCLAILLSQEQTSVGISRASFHEADLVA